MILFSFYNSILFSKMFILNLFIHINENLNDYVFMNERNNNQKSNFIHFVLTTGLILCFV